MPIDGDWYVTRFAAERYCFVRHWPPTERNRENAMYELLDIMRDKASLRKTDNQGRELWRMNAPPKIRIVVCHDKRLGPQPQIVWCGSGRPPEDHFTMPPEDEAVFPRTRTVRSPKDEESEGYMIALELVAETWLANPGAAESKNLRHVLERWLQYRGAAR